MERKKPVVCVPMGDAAGVGAELIVKAFGSGKLTENSRAVLLGDARILARAEKLLGKKLAYTPVEPENIRACGEDLMLADTGDLDPECIPMGRMNPVCGEAVAKSIALSLRFYAKGYIDGICFAPYNKEAIRRAGYPVASEMELYLKACADNGLKPGREHGELNVVDGLWTTRVTSHIPLTKLGEYLTRGGILDMIRLAHNACRTAGIAVPRIAVAALNPHCGEGGLCGTEEETMIRPAIEQARAEGLCVTGLFSADTIFLHAFGGEADAVVTMYHDQGQIALKLKGFAHAVTILGGLPLPVGTPAHGTAFDIAGKGIASESAFSTAYGIIARQAQNTMR